VAATLGVAKKDQISGGQQTKAAGINSYGITEALLLIGIPWNPNTKISKQTLNQS
jgi:hypothetical protein